MDKMDDTQRKKYIIIASVTVVLLLAITFVPMMFGGSDKEPPESKPEPPAKPVPIITIINGFSERAENLPASRIELIEKNLYETIKTNVSNDDNLTVTDAVIRDGSYKQSLKDSAKQIFFTTFVVDIPSLEQSYRVNDHYSPLPVQMSGLLDYATLVLCLDEDELIYGHFDCKDRIKMEQGL
jgi:hypothetical protein